MPIRDYNIARDQATTEQTYDFTFPSVTGGTSGIGPRIRIRRNVSAVHLGVSAGSASGTSPTLSATLYKNGVSTGVTTPNLTAAGVQYIDLNPGGEVKFAPGDILQVELTAGGTSPSFSNVLVWVTLRTAGRDIVNSISN